MVVWIIMTLQGGNLLALTIETDKLRLLQNFLWFSDYEGQPADQIDCGTYEQDSIETREATYKDTDDGAGDGGEGIDTPSPRVEFWPEGIDVT